MGAIYEYTDTVRYSKVDGELKLMIAAMIDYFQDAAIEQSEALGVGTKAINARNRNSKLLRILNLGTSVSTGCRSLMNESSSARIPIISVVCSESVPCI